MRFFVVLLYCLMLLSPCRGLLLPCAKQLEITRELRIQQSGKISADRLP